MSAAGARDERSAQAADDAAADDATAGEKASGDAARRLLVSARRWISAAMRRVVSPPTSLIGEVTRWSAAVLALGLAATLGAVELAKRGTAANLADFSLIDFIQEEIEPRLTACGPVAADCLIQVYQNETGGFWRVVDADGRAHDSFSYGVSAFADPSQNCARSAARRVGRFDIYTCRPGGADGLPDGAAELTYRVAQRSASRGGFALVALETPAWERMVTRALDRVATWRSLRLAIIAMCAALAATLIASLLLLRGRLARQFGRLAADLAAYRDGEQDRLEDGYPDEIQNLVNSFNLALDKNARLVARQRRNVKKMAHDLRHQLVNVDVAARQVSERVAETPSARAETTGSAPRDPEPTRDGEAQALLAETRRLAQLVERYLTLVDWVGPIEGQRPQPLRAALEATRKAFARRLRLEPVTIEVDCPPDLAARAHGADLGIILSNLTSNAHKFARSRIRLAAEPLERGGARLIVEDDGPGVPEAARARMMRWGERGGSAPLDDAPAGSGFGLTIVAEQVGELYGGRLALEQSRLGGLRVTVDLPGQTPVQAPESCAPTS